MNRLFKILRNCFLIFVIALQLAYIWYLEDRVRELRVHLFYSQRNPSR